MALRVATIVQKNAVKPGKAQKELSTFAAKYREGVEPTRSMDAGESVVLQLEQSLLNAPIQTAKQLLTRAHR